MASLQNTSVIPPYIGITSIQNTEQLAVCMAQAKDIGLDGLQVPHHLMTGFLASPELAAETLDSDGPSQFRSSGRLVSDYQTLVSLLTLAQQEAEVVPLVHFEFSAKGPEAVEQAISNRHIDPALNSDTSALIHLIKRLQTDGVYPGIQLNGVLPVDVIQRIRYETQAPLVLQVRQELSQRGSDALIRYLDPLSAGVVSVVLLDPSAGQGLPFNPAEGVRLYDLLATRFEGSFHYGIAGGFGGSPERRLRTIQTVGHFMKHCSPAVVSVDAETGVRSPGTDSTSSGDVLDLDLTDSYLRTVTQSIKEGQSRL